MMHFHNRNGVEVEKYAVVFEMHESYICFDYEGILV